MIFKTQIYDFDTYFEAEVEGLTLSKFGNNVVELKDQLAVFTSNTKAGVIQEIVKTLKALGYSGSLKIIK
jgi:hypothetical protein